MWQESCLRIVFRHFPRSTITLWKIRRIQLYHGIVVRDPASQISARIYFFRPILSQNALQMNREAILCGQHEYHVVGYERAHAVRF
jgi:hypothetical protein